MKRIDKKLARGRPSGFKPEYAEKLLKYFSSKPYRKIEEKYVDEKGKTIVTATSFVANDFPTLAGFAIKIGVHRDTLQEWAKVHPEFSVAYKRAKDFQENYLAVNGNKGLLSTSFAIFTAKNVLQWRDKQPDEVDVVINNHNLSDEQLDNKIETLMKKRD